MNPDEKDGSLFNGKLDGMPVVANLADFIEIALNAVIVFDANKKITYWNPAAERIYGWAASEVLGKSSEELFWPVNTLQEQADQRQRQIELKSGETLHGEYMARRKDGSFFWVEYTTRATFDKDGVISEYIAVHRDITEQKQTTQALEWNRNFIEKIAQTSPDIIFVFDLEQNRTVYTNGRIESILGYPVEQLESIPDLNTHILHPDDLARLPALMQTLLDGRDGEMAEDEFRVRAADGFYRWLSVRSTIFKRTPDGQPKQVIGVATDITERKRVENEIVLVAKMPAENPNPVMRMTPDGRVIYANDASEPLLDFWKRQTGQMISAEVQRGLREAFESDTKKMVEVEYDGKTLFCTLAPVREAGYVNFYGNDITERKQAEEILRRSEERARLLAKVGEFVRQLAEPDEFLYAVAESLGAHLEVRRSFFIEIDQANDRGFIKRDYCRGVPSVAGEYLLSNYSTEALQEMEAGRTVVNRDSKLDPRTADYYMLTYATYGDRAYMAVPLMRDERWVAALWVSTDVPRDWSSEEVTLIETVAERAWLSVEKIRLDQEVRHDRELLQKIFDNIPVMITRYRPDTRVLKLNPAFERTTGWTTAEARDMDLMEACYPDPGYRQEVREFMESVHTGWKDILMNTRDGRVIQTTWANIRLSDDTQVGIGLDITQRKRAEEELRLAREQSERNADRISRLQKVTAALSEALTPAQVAQVLVELGTPALGAVSGSITLLAEDGQTLELVQSASPEPVTRPYKRFSLSLNVPAAEVVRSGKPIWIRSRQEYIERYPHLVEQIEAWGFQAAAAIPLLVKDRKLGVLTLSFNQIREFTTKDQDFVLTLAEQGAQALERAQLYRQMRQALSELQMTYDQSPIGMIQLDTDLRYIRVNETLALYNGIPAAEHIGKSIQEIVPGLAPKIEEGIRRVMETGEPEYNVEVVGETKAEPGVPHTWLESWYPLREKGGRVVGLNIVVQDITNRKRNEHALAEFARQQEALYKLADRLHRTRSLKGTFGAALDAILNALQCDRASILLFDDSGIMRFVAWRGLSDGYRNAIDGHSPWKPDEKAPEPIYFNALDAAELDDPLKAIIKAEGIDSLAFIPLVSDGKLIGKFMIYFNTPHTFNVNELDLSLTIAHQLAFGIQRLRAEDALRESEERFRSMANAAPVMIWISGTDKLCTWFNKTWLDFAGRTLEEEIGNGWTENIHPDDLERCLQTYTASFDARRPFMMEYRLKRRDGEYRWVLDNGIPLYGPGNEFTGYIGTCIDFSERKRAEQVLRESEEQLQSLNETLEQKVREQTAEVRNLASDLTKAEQRERHRLAHILHDDLQQRFYAIRMQVELLLEGLAKENKALQKDSDEIKKQLNEIMLLIRYLSVDLSPPILRDEGLTQAIQWLGSQMQEKYGLRIELQAQDSFAVPDEDIQMLLFNCIRELLFNVVKHAGVRQAVVSLQQLDDEIRVEVRDKGKGFNISSLAWRAGQDINEDELQHWSFGLPTIRQRLSLFGGRMDIKSEPGAGTLIAITIPFRK